MCYNTFISDESDQTKQITIGLTLLIFLNLPIVWMHLLNIPSLQQGSWNRFIIAFKFDTHWINSKFSGLDTGLLRDDGGSVERLNPFLTDSYVDISTWTLGAPSLHEFYW